MTKDKRLGSDPLTWLKDGEDGQPAADQPQNGQADDVLDFLGQSEPRWSRAEVLENLPAPVCVASLLGEMLWANPAFFELSGLDQTGLAKKNWRDIFGSASDQNLGRRKVKTSQNKTYPSTLITPAGDSLDIVINRFFGKAAGLDEGYFFATLELPAPPPPEPEVVERIVEIVKEAEPVIIERIVEVEKEPQPAPHQASAPARAWALEGLTARLAAELLAGPAGTPVPQGKKERLAAGAKDEFLGLLEAEADLLGSDRLDSAGLCRLLAGAVPATLPEAEVELEIDTDGLSIGRALAAAWALICLGWSSDPAKDAEKAKKKEKKNKKKDHDADEHAVEETPDEQAEEPRLAPLQLSIGTQPDGGCQLRIWGGGLPDKLKLGKAGPMDLLAASLASAGGGLLGVRGDNNEFLAIF